MHVVQKSILLLACVVFHTSYYTVLFDVYLYRQLHLLIDFIILKLVEFK